VREGGRGKGREGGKEKREGGKRGLMWKIQGNISFTCYGKILMRIWIQ
jgi:hypothetical protein